MRIRSVIAGLVISAGAFNATMSGQSGPEPQPAASSFQQTVYPVLSENCLSCHSDRLRTGGLSLEAFRDPATAVQHTDVWMKVLDRLNAGTMPPPPRKPLSAADRAAVTGWIEKNTGAATMAADAATADPGRVTARRLNREEYNNTIRDLLGVSLRPADEFPVDDAGYGFDNIGDVLTMSPLLMEKYVNTARVISKVAVYGEGYNTKPSRITRLLPKRFQDDMKAAANEMPYSLRGSAYGTLHVPVDAEYEVSFRYYNYRGRFSNAVDQADAPARGGGGGREAAAPAPPDGAGNGGGAPAGRRGGGPRRPATDEERALALERERTAVPPEPLVFTVDGKEVYSYTVVGTGDFDYAHGENVFRVRLSAGDHLVRLSYPQMANLENPRTNVNPDLRRKLYIGHIDVIGPFSPSTAPPASFKKIFICNQKTDACARQIIENLITRAYRRPATPQEVKTLTNLAAQVRRSDSFEESIRVAIAAVLMSPNFLFRIEEDPGHAGGGAGAAASAYAVSDYALASRLSYFLWSSMPDEELMQAAAAKTLRQPAELERQLQRMLRDPKSEAFIDNFAGQWLNLRLMDRKKPDAKKFNVVDDELLDAMRRETELFVGAVVRENLSILDFIDGRFTYVNGPLARYYGIKGVDGEAFQRVELDGVQRSGIVTQGSVLTVASYATRTSPVLRGKWVLDNLVGGAPPPPPPDVPALVETDLGVTASMRERLEQHRANPACASCHSRMDPIGFALENYDAAGAWRTRDGNFEVDAVGKLPSGKTVAGAAGLKEFLRSQPDVFSRNFTEKLMTYALGRGLERSDRPVIEQIVGETARDGYRFSTLVTAIVNSRPFQMKARLNNVVAGVQ